jgi:hypothetical protein
MKSKKNAKIKALKLGFRSLKNVVLIVFPIWSELFHQDEAPMPTKP